MRSINEIILHCTATPEGRNDSVECIRSWHRQQGFNDIGYHYVITLDGKIHGGRPEEVVGAHCKNHNAHSIGVCYVGGMSKDMTKAKDTRTPAQTGALISLCRMLLKKYPKATIHGHNEFASKACPSFDVKAFIRQYGLMVLCAFFLMGCATKKHIGTEIEQVRIESNEQLERNQQDITLQQDQRDSTTQQNTQRTVIEFTFYPNGSYNHKTGEANGVQNVRQSEELTSLQQKISSQQLTIDCLSDSIRALNNKLTIDDRLNHDESERAYPVGWKFCLVCTCLFWLIVLGFLIRIAWKIYSKIRL